MSAFTRGHAYGQKARQERNAWFDPVGTRQVAQRRQGARKAPDRFCRQIEAGGAEAQGQQARREAGGRRQETARRVAAARAGRHRRDSCALGGITIGMM